MAAVLILGWKNQAAVQDALPAGLAPGAMIAARVSGVMSVVGFPLYFVLAAMILASADVLFRDSRRQLRLVEFTGVAFGVFLPVCLFLLAVAVFWNPPQLEGAGLDVQAAITRYAGTLRADPWLSTAGILYYFGLAWCAALLGVALHVVSSFSRMGAIAAAAAIFAALSGFWL